MIWYLLIAFTGAAWILLLGDVVWSLLRKPPRSPAQRLRMLGRLLLPLSGLILAVNLFGLQAGWPHDGAESTLRWTSFALVTVNLIWSFGQNHLIAVLAARAAARQGQSE